MGAPAVGVGGIAGTYQSPNINIPFLTPPNVPAELVPIIQPIYTAFQNLIQVLITNAGISSRPASLTLESDNDPTAYLAANVHRYYTQAQEAIAYGAPISLINFAESIAVVNANAATGLKAYGFCSTVGGIEVGSVGEVILNDGVILNMPGPSLEVGKQYYLSDQGPGQYSLDAPTNPSSITQAVGYAITTTALLFNASGNLDNSIPNKVFCYFGGYANPTSEGVVNLFAPSQKIFEVDFTFALTLPEDLSGSIFKLDLPPVNPWTALIYYNGEEVGNMVFPGGSTVPTSISFPAAINAVISDNLYITANVTTDAGAQGFRSAIVGTKGFG